MRWRMRRAARRVLRKTRETKIEVEVDLDRIAEPRVGTGLGFFDHMLEQLGKHGGFALALRCEGDLHIDEHHTIEDSALALGQALREALGDKRGIGRYGFTLPMDEALASAALDFSGRPCFVFDGAFQRERVGDMPTELVPHFFRSLCEGAGLNLHLKVDGDNDHHKVEACFKAVARALRQAIRREGSELAEYQGPAVIGVAAGDVALIDAGGANLGSVRYALERLGATARIVRDADGLRGARRVILPGVGAAPQAMDLLRERGLDDALRALQVPLLGVCLGMQLLFDASEEGDVDVSRPAAWTGPQARSCPWHPGPAHGLECARTDVRGGAARRHCGGRAGVLRPRLCGACRRRLHRDLRPRATLRGGRSARQHLRRAIPSRAFGCSGCTPARQFPADVTRVMADERCRHGGPA